jgi:hypothetical protein
MVFDGTTWSIDKDINVVYTLTTHAPLNPFVYRDELYWPFVAIGGVDNATGILFKRTTAGVWSKVLENRGLRGGLATYRDDATDEPGPTPPAVVGAFSSAFSSAFDIT